MSLLLQEMVGERRDGLVDVGGQEALRFPCLGGFDVGDFPREVVDYDAVRRFVDGHNVRVCVGVCEREGW